MKKSTVRTLLIVVAVCFGITLGYVLLNQTTKREATAEEIAANQAYAVDWTAIEGWDGTLTQKDFILNLCSYAGEKEIGNHVHKYYSSDVLAAHLHRCQELSEITLMNDILYITYFAADGDMIVLSYDDSGLTEKAVYDIQTDEMFHEINGEAMVWSKFRNGFQFGDA